MRRFQFVIALAGGGVAVRLVEVRSEQRARELAERMLRESTAHQGVGVWEGDDHLFSVGGAIAA